MAESFSDIGRIEAIDQLYRLSAYNPVTGLTYSSDKGGKVTTAARMYLEGIDFNLVYFPLKHLGYKCVVGVTGELYATLAHPKLLNVVLGISAKLDFPQVKDLWMGITVAAKEHGYEAVNLDLQPSNNGLYVSLAATGETSLLTDKRRNAAKSKDLICVSGALGAAYLGLQVLERGAREFSEKGTQPDMTLYKMLVGDYLRPELEADTVSRLEDAEIYPPYGYFVTKGLSDALKRLTRDSGLGAKVYADKIPFEGNSFQLGKELDIDPVSAAMNGGDDNRLLFVVPILYLEKFRRDFQTFDIIGHLAQPEAGTVLVTPEGVEFPVKAQGWSED
ncbi:MAG: thiamine-phosphate kinase [Bacteroidales bacterium]|nr:thiamine-phosphate kinase [Bacteroidales bacterium]